MIARLVIGASALVLSACATVEGVQPVSAVMLPDAFAMLDAETVPSGDIAALLPRDDAAFRQLSERAMADAPTLAAALARIDAARAGLRGASAARLPRIDGSAGVTASEGNGAQAGGNVPTGAGDFSRTTLSTGVDASWELDVFGRLRASERAAAARLDAAGADADAVRLALVSDIGEAVVDARTVAARATVIRADLTSASELVAITLVRTQAGISPGFDLVRAQSLAADARARLAPLAAERAAIIGRLVTLTALPTADVMAALDRADGPAMTARPVPDAPSLLLRARPDVRAAEARLSAADAEIAVAAAERFPRLTLTGTLGLLALGVGGLFDEDALVGTLGGGIAGPLLDFGRIAARIEGRQAEGREAFAVYRGILFRALGESEAALGALRASDERVRLLEEQAALDTDAIGLARERYRRGLDTFLTVIDAERSANASRSALAGARGTAQRARVALYRALGGVR